MAEEKKAPKAPKNDEQLSDEGLEQASGGVIDGGCIPPFFPPPILTTIDSVR